MRLEWHVFIDESGNDGMDLNQPQVSQYYVLAAIVSRASDVAIMRKHFLAAKTEQFKNADEMKSEYIGNDSRRLIVSAALAEASFDLHVRITDKKLLHGPGFRYAGSFIKYLLGDLVGDLVTRYGAPMVSCDNIKTPSFEKDVSRYLYARFPRTLMRQWTFGFQDSIKDPCIQAADLISGTVRRCCQRSPEFPEQDQLLQLFGKQIAAGTLRRFPRERTPATLEDIPESVQSYDPELEMRAVSEAEAYVQRHINAGAPQQKALVLCAQELLKQNTLQTNRSWVSTRRLAAVCENALGEAVSPRRVRSFIGRLRDDGLLIASRRHLGGYKLPSTRADVVEFLNTQNEKIKPMMRRIQKARNTLYSVNGTDILDGDTFQNLQSFLPSIGTPGDDV